MHECRRCKWIIDNDDQLYTCMSVEGTNESFNNEDQLYTCMSVEGANGSLILMIDYIHAWV